MPALIVFLLLILCGNELWELYQLVKGHLERHQTKALLHVSNELRRELAAESDLSEDVPDIGFDGNVFIDHGNLLCIKGELPLVDIYTQPEFLHLLLDDGADFSDAVHFFERSLIALSLVHQI